MHRPPSSLHYTSGGSLYGRVTGLERADYYYPYPSIEVIN